MPDYRSLEIYGKIINTGGLSITQIGFILSEVLPPDYGPSPNIIWCTSLDALKPDYTFTDTVTGLTANTHYYVRSFARNSVGLSMSDYTVKPFEATTTGVVVLPTITCYIMNNNSVYKVGYEIGTENNLVVSGETTQNDEIIFDEGELNQSSQPPVTNPIKMWDGYQQTYSTLNPAIQVNFLPEANNPSSWSMIQTVSQNCGSPSYEISATATATAYFPFLWVLKSAFQPASYFYYNWPINYTGDYFYKNASTTPNGKAPINGKLVDGRGEKHFLMTPSSESLKYLSLGYPASYGNCLFSIDEGSNWIQGSLGYLVTREVGTGPAGINFGIIHAWATTYKILQYQFTRLDSMPIPFWIKFE